MTRKVGTKGESSRRRPEWLVLGFAALVTGAYFAQKSMAVTSTPWPTTNTKANTLTANTSSVPPLKTPVADKQAELSGVCAETSSLLSPSEIQVGPPHFLLGSENHDGSPLLWLSTTHFIMSNVGFSFFDHGRTDGLTVTDSTTGTQTQLDGINSLVRKTAWRIGEDGICPSDSDGHLTRNAGDFRDLHLSPDGRWLLGQSHDSQGQPLWVILTLDGTVFGQWPRHIRSDWGDGQVEWMRDSAHFIEIVHTEGSAEQKWQACVYSLDRPEVQEFPLALPETQGTLLRGGSYQLVLTGDGHGWIVGQFSGERYEIVPGPQGWSLHRATLLRALPPESREARGLTNWPDLDYQAASVVLSPSGNWVVWRDNAENAFAQYHLNISRADGSETRTIFTSDLPGGSGFYDFQWTPDEQNIIFSSAGNATTQRGLYMMSVGQVLARSEAHRHPCGTQLASRTEPHGPFPTAAGQHWNVPQGTLLARNFAH